MALCVCLCGTLSTIINVATGRAAAAAVCSSLKRSSPRPHPMCCRRAIGRHAAHTHMHPRIRSHARAHARVMCSASFAVASPLPPTTTLPRTSACAATQAGMAQAGVAQATGTPTAHTPDRGRPHRPLRSAPPKQRGSMRRRVRRTRICSEGQRPSGSLSVRQRARCRPHTRLYVVASIRRY